MQSKDKFTEIFIRCQEEGIFVIGGLQYLLIGNTRVHFRNIEHVMPIAAKPLDHRKINAFIGEKIHELAPPVG